MDGSEVDRLFVWSEQGVGDEVMFASCFNDLVHKCDRLLWHVSVVDPNFPAQLWFKIKFIDRKSAFSDQHFIFKRLC